MSHNIKSGHLEIITCQLYTTVTVCFVSNKVENDHLKADHRQPHYTFMIIYAMGACTSESALVIVTNIHV